MAKKSAPSNASGSKAVPGAPASETPSLEEPTIPRGPLGPKPDQQGPAVVSPTGAPSKDAPETQAQQGEYLTTSQGTRLPDSDHSLKVGPRGPVLLRDHHLREKINHFDHERIPERAVHARGAGAHGTFTGYGTADKVTKAKLFGKDVETPVFVRFSTVAGSRGSGDLARDVRGFATKFYSTEGTWDLVGNNIPVFFIQDGIKFPDLVHSVKPEQAREIPQAQSAHDTFWDFVSLHTEAAHMTVWQMSDRAIPASFRTMQGFGVHTFRLEAADGSTSLVKFHWKPKQGIHSMIWEECLITNGCDPDFHRRDLADNIESGNYPQWELGIQIMPDTPDQMFEGIDLLDPTKIVPEELCPVQPIGLMELNRNPVNFFAETEQVAFSPGHLVPGIDVTDDPLLAARLFSYIDTQMSRLGGPNFHQIPINRPHAPVNDNQRDAMHQSAVHGGNAYRPNSIDGGCPFQAGADVGAYIEVPHEVAAGRKVREAPATFADHFSQATLFYKSLTPVEQDHVAGAYTFELTKCYETPIRERALQMIANIDADLAVAVADGLGMQAPKPDPKAGGVGAQVQPSPALSQLGKKFPVTGRKVGIVVGPDSDLTAVKAARSAVESTGMVPVIVAPKGGELGDGLVVGGTYQAARSIEFDAMVAAGPLPAEPEVAIMFSETFRHCKAMGGWGDVTVTFAQAFVDPTAPGVVVADKPDAVIEQVAGLLESHRVWDRFPPKHLG